MNIYARMRNITAGLKNVQKNLEVELPNGRGYKAVSEVDILRAVKPLEAEHGVYSYPVERRIVESGEIVNTYKGNEKKSLFVRIETRYRFVNIDEPSEFIDVITYGDGVDSQDKAPGKAMTYADKYALLKAYKIQTGEDPDAYGSGELLSKMSNELASDFEKDMLKQICKEHDLNPVDVLKANGWTSGKLTKAQHGLAMKWLKEKGYI